MEIIQKTRSQRNATGVQRTIPSLDKLGILFLCLPLFVTFYTIDSARWVNGLPPFYIQAPLAFILSSVLLGIIKNQRLAYFSVLGLGLSVSLIQGLWLLRESSIIWFGVAMLTVIWLTGLATTILSKRLFQPIISLLPSLVVLAIALGFLSSGYHQSLPFFFLSSIPALVYYQSGRWSNEEVRRRPHTIIAAIGIATMSVTVLTAWIVPSPNSGMRPGILKYMEEPFFAVVERYSGAFTAIPNRKDWPRFELQEKLTFTEPIAQSEDVLMIVKAEVPYKWRLRTYEIYTPNGWITQPVESMPMNTGAISKSIRGAPSGYELLPIRVRTSSFMTSLASAGRPAASEFPSFLRLSPDLQFTVGWGGAPVSYVPKDVETSWSKILDTLASPSDAPQGDRLENSLLTFAELLARENLRLTNDQPSSQVFIKLERANPSSAPPIALMFRERRYPPRTYETIGLISTALPEDLKSVNGEIPQWISDRYLQLPPEFPANVRVLARDLAIGQDDVYSIADAIATFLRAIPYNTTDWEPPPLDRDPVEWFLTTQEIGFCNYYASAMITMLRSLGIPARLVTGFAPGEWDESRGVWIVKMKHYHAWPEVYIPGHGWVEFEPTPSNVQPSLQYLGFTYTQFGSRTVDIEPNSSQTCGDAAFEAGSDCIDPVAITSDTSGSLGIDLSDPYTVSMLSRTSNIRSVIQSISLFTGFMILAILLVVISPQESNSRKPLADRIYAHLRILSRAAGVRVLRSQTPQELGYQLGNSFPKSNREILTIINVYTRYRYSSDKLLSIREEQELTGTWSSLRRHLALRILSRIKPWGRPTKFTAMGTVSNEAYWRNIHSKQTP